MRPSEPSLVVWVVRFLAEFRRLDSHIDPALLADRGCALWEVRDSRAPEDVARAEYAAYASVVARRQ